jgi:hypothetical protein
MFYAPSRNAAASTPTQVTAARGETQASAARCIKPNRKSQMNQ